MATDRSNQPSKRLTINQLKLFAIGEFFGIRSVDPGCYKNSSGCPLGGHYAIKLTHRLYSDLVDAPLFALDKKRLSRTVFELQINPSVCAAATRLGDLISQAAVCFPYE